jgi:uracil-DNA glycosylase
MTNLLQQLKEHLDRENIREIPSSWLNTSPPDLFKVDQRFKNLEKLKEDFLKLETDPVQKEKSSLLFGFGNIHSPTICFIGEAPSAEEYERGEFFVGAAGKLLADAITKGMKLQLDEIYHCNILKSLPSTPSAVELATPILFQQLKLLEPKIIMTLGELPQKILLGDQLEFNERRGNWFEWNGIQVFPTFHPSLFLSHPEMKKEFWNDLQKLMREI